MSSSQFVIFCIILIALFPLHDYKTRSCAHCYRPSERQTSFFKSREECTAACKA
ncbi:hypothetical protein YC2023_015968 [Brassica napus]